MHCWHTISEAVCCECCHYCVQRHFVRHNPREYASNGIVPHLVASVNASRLLRIYVDGRLYDFEATLLRSAVTPHRAGKPKPTDNIKIGSLGFR
jgi:hypothetical protein